MVELTKKGKKFIWKELCEEAFKQLKIALVSSEVMAYPSNDAGQFDLDVDASESESGAYCIRCRRDKTRLLPTPVEPLTRQNVTTVLQKTSYWL